jgi:sorbitol-6-phosphate 2-dehydrogenase
MKFSDDRRTAATTLCADEAAKAAEVAPKLRMLHDKRAGRASVISFRVDINIPEDAFLTGKVLLVEPGNHAVEAFEYFAKKYGAEPAIVLADGLGFAIGMHMEAAAKALEVFLAHLDGKPADWNDISATSSLTVGKRLCQKIMVVTGGAQGFGYGIAKYAAENGAYIAIADVNMAGAERVCKEFNAEFGPYCAIPIQMDVTSEQQVREGIEQIAAAFGGIDVFQSNAGVLRAGATDTLSLEDFNYVTNINYVGYFICAKQAFILMKRQHEINPDYWMDIIQTNSKSGLTGSNKNCSYAGSKFGTIGLTQSFAMEMADFNIKVNSVCPGNFLHGPLWSDPENGLFAQYLRTNKIPGAKTTDDLIRYYNEKVPMRRSCESIDVARAVLYLIEQDYETGQALPVSGGQLMLR